MSANRDEVLEIVIAFDKAYEELDALHAAGKLGAGNADFSKENLERVKRVCRVEPREGCTVERVLWAAPISRHRSPAPVRSQGRARKARQRGTTW